MSCQFITNPTRKTLEEEIQAKLQLQNVTCFSDVEYHAEKLVRKLMGRPNHCSTLTNYVTGKDSEGYDFGRQKSFRFRLIPEERGYPNSILYDYIVTSGGCITKKADDPYAVTILNDLYYVLREDEDIILPSDCYSSSLIYEAIKREMFDLPLPDPKAHLLTPSKYESYDLWKILRREMKWSDLKMKAEEVETKSVTARKCARMIYEILSADSKDTILKWKQVCGIEKSPPSPSTSAAVQGEEIQEKKKKQEALSSSISFEANFSSAKSKITRQRTDDSDTNPTNVNVNAAIVSQMEGIGRQKEVENVTAAVSTSEKPEMERWNDFKDRTTASAITLPQEGVPRHQPQPLPEMTVTRGRSDNSTARRSSIASVEVVAMTNPGEEDWEEDILPAPLIPIISTSFDSSIKISRLNPYPHPPPEMTMQRSESKENATATATTTGANRSSIAVVFEEPQGQEDVWPSSSSPTSSSYDGTYSRKSVMCLDQDEILSMLMILDDDEDETNADADAGIEMASNGKDIHRQEFVRISDYDCDNDGVNRLSSHEERHHHHHPPPESIVTPTRKRRMDDDEVGAFAAKATTSRNVHVSTSRSILDPEDEENEEDLFVPLSPVFSDGSYRYAVSPSSPEDIVPLKRRKSDENVKKKNTATEKVPEPFSPSHSKGKVLELSSIMNTPEGHRRLVQVTPKNTVRSGPRKMSTRILELSSIVNPPESEGQGLVQIERVAPRQRNAVLEPLASSTPNVSVNRSVPVEDTSGVNVDIEEGTSRNSRGTPVSVRLPVKLAPRAVAVAGPSKVTRTIQKRRKSAPPAPVPVPASRSKDASDSEMDDVQFSEEDEKSVHKSKEPRRRTYLTGKREDFKPEEEYLIVKKICEAKAFLNTRSRSIYQDMTKTKEFKDRRTWVALYDRFRKFIGPQLERLVDDDDEREIKKYANKCGISLEDFKELLKGLEISNKNRRRPKFFKPEEEYLIVRKICEVKAFLYTGGLNLFMDMAKSKDFNGRRTGTTLSDHFKRLIRPKLLDEKQRKSFAKKCVISSDDLKELLEGLKMSKLNSYQNCAPKYKFD